MKLLNKTPAQPDNFSKLISYIETLFYTLMISFVIFGVSGYICSQAIHKPGIQLWTIIFIAGIIAALLSLLYFKPYTYVKREFSLKDFVLGLIPYLVVLPGVIALLFSVRVQLSAHGAFHVGYIFQILYGFSPPENVVLPGYPANVYWLYHALIAVLVNVFNAAPPLIAALINLTALITSLYWIRKSISLLGLDNRNSFITSCYAMLILFGTNLFGSIHVVLNYIIDGKLSFNHFIDSITYKSMMLGGDVRLVSLAKKFFNFNGTPLGVLYFCFAIYISLLILKGGLSTKKILLLAVALSGALMFHTTSGLFALLIIPLSLLISLLYTHRRASIEFLQNIKAIEWTVLIIIILFLFVPVFHYIYVAARALPAETHIGTSISYNLISILSVAYPLIPLSIIGVFLAYREKTDFIIFLSSICVLGYLLSLVVVLPGNNQYKFVFLSTISLSFLSVIGLDYMYYRIKGKLRLAGKFLFSVIFIILGFNILLSGFDYLTSTRFLDNTHYYDNKHISLREGTKYKDVFEWIRDNTTTDTIVILPLPTKNTGRDGARNGNIYIVTERLPYVAYGHIYAEGIDEYYSRVENVKLFYSNTTPVDKKVEILDKFKEFSRERPSILLIPKENLKSLDPHSENLRMIYSGKDANLYYF